MPQLQWPCPDLASRHHDRLDFCRNSRALLIISSPVIRGMSRSTSRQSKGSFSRAATAVKPSDTRSPSNPFSVIRRQFANSVVIKQNSHLWLFNRLSGMTHTLIPVKRISCVLLFFQCHAWQRQHHPRPTPWTVAVWFEHPPCFERFDS